MPKCQFDCFSLEINFKRACSCNYGISRLGSSKRMNYVSHELPSLYFLMLEVFQKCSLFTVGSIPLVDLKFCWVSLMHLSIHKFHVMSSS